MDYKEIFNYVLENYKDCNYQFIVTINGVKTKKRLFISANSYLCEFKKNSRKRGEILFDVEGWQSISVQKASEKSKYDRLMNTAKKAVSYMEKSGLWPCFKADLELLINTDRSIIEDVIEKDWDGYMAFKKEHSLSICGDMFFNLIEVGIKTVKYDKYLRENQMNSIKKSIETKTNYRLSWTNGYDNSIEVRNENDCLKGWYSEEYRGCGNGYYYFLIDEKHVLFCEKD